MSDVDTVDFFTDKELLADPYDYLAALRDECPLRREKHHDVVMVTGYDEGMAICNDTERFSSCISVTGPFPDLPVPLEGDYISALIAAHRDEIPFYDQLPTFDPPVHTAHRALLSRMITPNASRRTRSSSGASPIASTTPRWSVAAASLSASSPIRSRCWSSPICWVFPSPTTRSSAKRC